MYGTQPPAARRLAQHPQHSADGGLVARMKSADAGPSVFGARGLSQLRDMVPKMAAMGFQQEPAPAPTPAPAPVADPRAAQLQAMIPRMEAMGYKQQPQYLARGGMVRGPGTGTSDSIATEAEPGTFIMPADSTEAIGPTALEQMGTVPVRLSDGEYKVPPGQVMAIGEAVLKLMKDATHAPVNGVDGGQTGEEVSGARGFAPGAQERLAEMPEQLYADGGLIRDDVTRVGNSYSGGNVGGSITVNGEAPEGTFSENPGNRVAQTPAPSSPAPTTVSVTRATPTPAAAPPAGASPAPAAPMGWAERNAQRNLQVTASSILDSPERRMAQAALAPSPTPAQPASIGFDPAAQRLGAMPASGQQPLGFQPRRYADGGTVEDDLQKRLAQIPSGGPAGWAGGGAGGAVSAQPAVPAPAPVPVPATAPAQPAGALSRAALMSAPAPAVQALSAMPENPSGGQVSTQNVDAAQGLARRGAADAMALMPNAPQPVQAPTVRHSGNDWAARNALRNAEVSASSIMNNGGKWDQTGGRNPAALAYNAAVGTDAALQAAEPGLAVAAMKENSETNRATLRERGLAAQAMATERGAMDRTLVKEQGDNIRTGLTSLAQTEAARIKAAQENKAPAGYRWAAGGKLEPIPGGPAGDGKPLTEDQAKSAGYALRMDNALKLIDDVGKKDPGAIRPGALAAVTNALPETLANTLRPEARQRVEAAQLDALDAALTLNTGAAYTREQLQGMSRSYFAQPGDDDKTVADKGNRLQSLIDTARLRAGEKGAAMTDTAQAKNAARTGSAPAAEVPPQIAELQRRAAANPALAARLKEMGY